MDGIVPKLDTRAKRKLRRHLRRCKEAKLRTRYLVVLNLAEGRKAGAVAAVLGVARSTVYRVAGRFRQYGEAGLLDGRQDNGSRKLDGLYLWFLARRVAGRPQEYGWRRPTWTRALLIETLARATGVRIGLSTMSKALRAIGARRGRPRPVVRCPWPGRARIRRIGRIRQMLADLSADEAAVYADELDVDLNPKIGWDWMLRGQQKAVLTPGQNRKRYVAGALDAGTGRLTWVEGNRKNSLLFIDLLKKLAAGYPAARAVHVVLDNFCIHDSRITRAYVAGLGGRVVLHFLPPYCPNENKIERLWQDLHAAVTRNHGCEGIESLMAEVHRYLRRRSRAALHRHAFHAA